MATKYYLQPTGNFSTAANWNNGTVPSINDTVYANGQTITIDSDINIGVGTLTTEVCPDTGIGGGGFNYITQRIIIGNIVAGLSNCVYNSTTTARALTVIGNLSSVGSFYAVAHYMSTVVNGAPLYIVGNVGYKGIQFNAGSNNSRIYLRIDGNVNSTANGVTINCATSPTVTTCEVIINGTYIGNTYPLFTTPISQNNSIFSIVGGVISQSPINLIKCDTLNIVGTITNFGGYNAIVSNILKFSPTNSTSMIVQDTDGVDKPLYTADAFNIIESDYRKDAVFGLANEFVGTLAVPPPSLVIKDVPTDATVGTWAFETSLIERLKKVVTTEELGEIWGG